MQFIYLSIINDYKNYIIILIFNIVLILYLLPKIKFFKKYYDIFNILNYIFILLVLSFYSVYILFLGIPIFFEYFLEKKIKLFLILLGILVIIFIRNVNVLGEYSLIFISSCALLYKDYVSSRLLVKLKQENQDLKEKNKKAMEKINVLKDTAFQIEYNTKLKERNNISQKLHDKIGHTIAGSLIQLEAIKLIIKEDKSANKMLENVIYSLRRGMEDIRIVLKNIKPNKLEIGINSIKLILKEFKEKTGIETYFIFEGNINLISYNLMEVIVESLKEVLTNIIKHSNADKFSLNIDVMNKIIRVEFKDNGITNKNFEKGMGLLGIEERVSKVNGKVTFMIKEGFIINIIVMME